MRAGFGCSLQGLKVHMHLLNSAAIQTLLRRDERQCACGLIVREHSGHRMVRVAAPRLHFGQQVFVQTRSAARALGRWGAAMAMRSGIACGGSVASVRHSWIAGATRSASTLLDHTGEDSRPPRVPPAQRHRCGMSSTLHWRFAKTPAPMPIAARPHARLSADNAAQSAHYRHFVCVRWQLSSGPAGLQAGWPARGPAGWPADGSANRVATLLRQCAQRRVQRPACRSVSISNRISAAIV